MVRTHCEPTTLPAVVGRLGFVQADPIRSPHLSGPARVALARERPSSRRIDGTVWRRPADENPRSRRHAIDDRVRLLAPFDPVVEGLATDGHS